MAKAVFKNPLDLAFTFKLSILEVAEKAKKLPFTLGPILTKFGD